SFCGVLIASLFIYLFSNVFRLTSAQGFLVIGILNLFLTVATLIVLPDFLLRFIALAITRCFYRINTRGIENVPVEGPALLISNHVSWVDAFLLMATNQRRIRFIMSRSIYSVWWLRPLFRLMGVIPLSFTDTPKKLQASLEEARKTLDEGYLVCIFAEGQITKTGHIRKFRKGFEKIVSRTPHPIVPVCIAGAWGSIFSYYYGKALSRLPYMIPYPVTILFGRPMPSTSTALEVRLAVMELSGEMFEMQKQKRMSLSGEFIRTAKQNWFSKALCDSTGQKLTYGRALAATLILSSKLKNMLGEETNVGILLPASAGGALCNLSVMMLGKVPVNINFTASSEAIGSAIKQCGMKNIITSRLFLKKMKDFPVQEGLLYMEDLSGGITKKEKITSLLKARFIPRRFLDQNPFPCPEKTATIIFSSGSTAEPKGVVLTHHNIASNIEAIRMILKIGSRDSILGALPFFHSFGFTGTLFFPLISGFSAFYHPNPLDSAKIVSLIRDNRITILLATPTFLMSYMRKAGQDDFRSLRYVIVGAERLATRLSQAFTEKYGIQILEGYGATELSPIASVNIPDVEVDSDRHVGTKEGSVGHPLPGVTVKIIDPDTGSLMPHGSSGLLLIKGPNVMKEYLNNPAKTGEVLKDGWYTTGDMASLDRDGFITITGRLSRFSKIAGEMVPHEAVEEAILRGLHTTEQVVVVTAVPDEKKGEKIAVLYLDKAGSADELHQIVTESDMPNLWKPKKENFYRISEMPLLGSGKLNLKAIKKIADEKAKEGKEAP
ncbi:MAG: AMP-binding protein, partial [Candidatus Aureabacteria bacterium]|nr:AMP-binding protein [Candidatus Auribacterota bacterium]